MHPNRFHGAAFAAPARRLVTIQTTVEQSCRICSDAGPHALYVAREMMFGMRDSFEYFQCSDCGCLQIREFPEDPSRYYPQEYYSFAPPPSGRSLEDTTRPLRVRYAFTGKGIPGRLLSLKFPYSFSGARRWISISGVSWDSRILDVGCGAGELLRDMATMGFRDLTGVDPMLAGPIETPPGVRIERSTIHDLDGAFDLIMLHHTLEHIPDQAETMRSAARLLAPGGWLLVRVPVSDSYAWSHYRENWVQLDPPRHYFLHSRRSLHLLGEGAGLRLAHVEHDSTAFQFLGSEMYRRGIPLVQGAAFSRRENWGYRRRAAELNAAGEGDQAAFYFTSAAAATAAPEG